MDRRKFLRFGILWTATATAAGCKTQVKQFDRPPKRGLLEDRWPGFYFNVVTARYSLSLLSPSRALSRPSHLNVPVLASDGQEINSGIGLPTIRPTHAVVNLKYDANSSANCEVAVTVFWPIDAPTPIDGRRETEETMTALVGFEEIRRFIDGTGLFRCDDDNHFYGPSTQEKDFHRNDFTITIQCRIEGDSPDSQFDGEIEYRDATVLYEIAERAVPGIT